MSSDAFVTISSLTMMSGGSVSPFITFTALSTAALPISYGNCATDASIVPAAIAFFASSSASNPMTRILPVLPAGGDRLDRAERHQVARGKHRVDVRVRLQHVLEDVEALIALPVRRL